MELVPHLLVMQCYSHIGILFLFHLLCRTRRHFGLVHQPAVTMAYKCCHVVGKVRSQTLRHFVLGRGTRPRIAFAGTVCANEMNRLHTLSNLYSYEGETAGRRSLLLCLLCGIQCMLARVRFMPANIQINKDTNCIYT